MTNLLTSIQGVVTTLTVIIGLIVLIALHDVTAAVGVPAILTLAGVHVGANLTTPAATTTTTPTTTVRTGPIQ